MKAKRLGSIAVLVAAAWAVLLHAGGAAAEVTGKKWQDERLFVPPYGQNGCWTLFFAGAEFEPPAARLNGPTFIEKFEADPVVIPELKNVGGPVFLRSAQSVIVGPRARLLGYESERFSKRSLVLDPGQQVADLVDIGFHERVESLQVECVRTKD